MERNQYSIKARVYLHANMPGAWHFVSIPKKQSADIKKMFGVLARGWGSLPVEITLLRRGSGQVGKTKWKTSIFPDKKANAYLLPIKNAVRQKEGIVAGDTIIFGLEILA